MRFGDMSIVVVGSVALDSVETPYGKVQNALGGSATYFSVSASFFTNDVKLVATELNVFEKFSPKVPDNYKNSEYLFLANINPELQMDVLRQVKKSKLVACDTMNLWIAERRDHLMETLKHVDILIINDAEARQLTGEKQVNMSARKILEYGPSRVIIKKGEHGAMTLTNTSYFSSPAYPLKLVFDPTGAGDTFAGGFMGYLASTDDISEQNIRKAIVYGTVMASFDVEDFSLNRQRILTREEIETRFAEVKAITEF
jgi:sugar/nucleoside kinase (ribokinase family)